MFPVGHALAMAMAIGHVTIIPGDAISSGLVLDLPPQRPYQPSQGKETQSQGSPYRENHIQQEVLVGGHLVHSGAQVIGTMVTEDVADPIDGPGHRVAWLVFVNVGEQTCLLAVPRYGKTEVGYKEKSCYGQTLACERTERHERTTNHV